MVKEGDNEAEAVLGSLVAVGAEAFLSLYQAADFSMSPCMGVLPSHLARRRVVGGASQRGGAAHYPPTEAASAPLVALSPCVFQSTGKSKNAATYIIEVQT